MYGSARGLWGSSTGLLTQLPYLRAEKEMLKHLLALARRQR
jgi:hypothetical protein